MKNKSHRKKNIRLPTATIRERMFNNGLELVESDALDHVIARVHNFLDEFCGLAKTLTKHAKRKKVMLSDVAAIKVNLTVSA